MTRRKHCSPHRKARVYLRSPLMVLCGLIFALSFDGTGIVRIGLLSALFHETGHIAVYRYLWGRWPDLSISPFGICLMTRGAPANPLQEFFLAAAGPLANLVACFGMLWLMRISGYYRYAFYWFACTNLLVGGVNLLPLPGLDGQRMLKSLFHRW